MLKNPHPTTKNEGYLTAEDKINLLSEGSGNYESLKDSANKLFIEIIKTKDELIDTLRDEIKEKDSLIEAFRSGKIVYVNNPDRSKE